VSLDAFLYRDLPILGKRVLRLGLAGSFGLDQRGTEKALAEHGINYVFWTPRMAKATPAVRAALKRDRERYVVATGPATAWWGGNVQRFVDRALSLLDTDYLDLLQMHWLGVTSSWRPSTVDSMLGLRIQGKVRALGVSIHDRKRAGEFAEDSPLDSLMIRYNAAHPGAEQDIFPRLDSERRFLIAYTATCWRRLLSAPRSWTGRVPTAGDCYRFCLSNPAIAVVLTGPANLQQLEDNLDAFRKGPLDSEEMGWMREFGRLRKRGSPQNLF
jgi:aryl-alcohol dehydrogenase-like predicted oxidoreductase